MRSSRATPGGRAIVTTGLLVLAAGCAGLPPTHYYVIEPRDRPAETLRDRGGVTIGVATFEVDPPYDQDRIVYRIGEDSTEVGFYAYDRWAAPLARMLPTVVAGELRGVPGVLGIEPAASGRAYEATLRGRLLAFEEVDTSAGPRVRVRVELRLFRADGTEIWSQRLARDVPVAADRVEQIVAGLRGALADAVHATRPDLQRALQGVKS